MARIAHILLLSTIAAISAAAPSATLDAGVVIGTTTALPSATAVVNKFLGIPFATSPPVRFEAAVPPKPWSTSLEVTKHKPACFNQHGYPEAEAEEGNCLYFNPPIPESEDCLYLNVWAPSGSPKGGGWPVMLWFHGGALKGGSGALSLFDGTVFATNENIVLVTTNYRLSVFGFPQHADELPLKERNLGYQDQRLALDWIQRNIKAFGGDPQKVTIFGGSAGGRSVDTHLHAYSREEKVPFRAGIVQSGIWNVNGVPSRPETTIPESQSHFGKLAKAFNCTSGSSLKCLRALDGVKIQHTVSRLNLNFSPTFDNYTVFANMAERRQQGLIPKLPVLIGSNTHENQMFVRSEHNLSAYLQSQFPGNVQMQQKVVKAYPLGGNLVTENDVIVQISSDLKWTCATLDYAELSSKAGHPTWTYRYNASFPNLQPYPSSHAFHTAEIYQVFGTYASHNASWALNSPVTSEQVILSRYMANAWANFARNPEGGPGWPKVGDYNEGVAMLGLGTGGAKMFHRDNVGNTCKLLFDSPAYIG